MPPGTTAMTMKRIHKELADLNKERAAGSLGGITLGPVNLADGDLLTWKATIPGPEGSPYEGGTYHVDVHLPADYPFSAPKVHFATMIYHMNISERGSVCIDILKHAWSPALSLFKVVLSLSSLMTDPNPKDPLVPSIAQEYLRHRPQHDATARRWTQLPGTRACTRAPAPAGGGAAGLGVFAALSFELARDIDGLYVPQTDSPINLAVDEQPGPSTAMAKRKRAAAPDAETDIVDLTEEDGPSASGSGSGTRKRARGNGAGAQSRDADGDVIVIED